MQFTFENQHEARAFALALGVILLGFLAVAVFILSGGGIPFYIFAVLAIAVGFYMAFHMSKAPAAAPEARKAVRKATKRAAKR
jgi:uncharacterized membrane protein YfcA